MTNKTTVITGAGSGIGATVARLLSDRGHQVIVSDLAESAAAQVASGCRPCAGSWTSPTIKPIGAWRPCSRVGQLGRSG